MPSTSNALLVTIEAYMLEDIAALSSEVRERVVSSGAQHVIVDVLGASFSRPLLSLFAATDVAQVAFVVRTDREADAVEGQGRGFQNRRRDSVRVRPCCTVAEAERWLEDGGRGHAPAAFARDLEDLGEDLDDGFESETSGSVDDECDIAARVERVRAFADAYLAAYPGAGAIELYEVCAKRADDGGLPFIRVLYVRGDTATHVYEDDVAVGAQIALERTDPALAIRVRFDGAYCK